MSNKEESCEEDPNEDQSCEEVTNKEECCEEEQNVDQSCEDEGNEANLYIKVTVGFFPQYSSTSKSLLYDNIFSSLC